MNSGKWTILTALSLLAVGGLWFGCFRRQHGQPGGPPRLFAAVLAVGFLCRVAFVFFTPVFYAPDEQAHFNYIKYLSEHQAFPVQTGKLGDPANDWEYCQPPLYYLALVPAFHAAQAVFHNQGATVLVLRCFSVLLWLLNVWFGTVLLKRLRITDPAVWLFVMALVCLLPTYTFVSAAINNDNLLATLGGGLLCLMARREASLKASLALGLLLGLALLTKQSALVFIPAVVLWSVLDGRSRRARWATGPRAPLDPTAVDSLPMNRSAAVPSRSGSVVEDARKLRNRSALASAAAGDSRAPLVQGFKARILRGILSPQRSAGRGAFEKRQPMSFVERLLSPATLWRRGRLSVSRCAPVLTHLVLVLGAATLVYSPWALRNWQLYGTWTPEFLVVTRLPWPSMMYGIASAAHNLVKTFWAVSGISNNIGYPFPLVGMIFLLLCVTWHPAGPRREGRLAALNVAANGPLLAAAALAVLLNVMLVLRFGYLFGMGQGRHLFPVLYPIALLLAARWRSFPVNHLAVVSAGLLMAYAVAFTGFSLWRFP